MWNELLQLSCSLVTVLAAADVAPPPREIQPVYFSASIGTKWVYEVDGKEESEEVVAVKKSDDGQMVTLRSVDRSGAQSKSEYLLNKDGLFRITGGLGPDGKHPPMHLLKLPHREGMKWSTFLGAWGLGDNSLVSTGPEKLKVPAGAFDAIRVDTRFPNRYDGRGTPASYWYAADIGLVKRSYGTSERVLKSFTKGK